MKYIRTSFISFRLGFNFFVRSDRKDLNYFIETFHLLHHLNGKKVNDTNMTLTSTIGAQDPNDYAYLFNSNLKFFDKNLLFKLLKNLGLFCIVIGVSGYQIHNENLGCIIKYYGCIYVLFNL